MVLFSLVASHTDLDLETVGTLSTGAANLAAAVSLPAVTLATCNRLEIYAEAPSSSDQALAQARGELLEAVARSSGMDTSEVSNSFTTLVEDDAVSHLFSVGAGLDSAVVGEREIAGQVRRALSEAQSRGTVSSGLTKLFETSSRTAKEVGASTALGSRGRSMVSVALDIAADMRGRADDFFRGARAVLIGTGSYAGTTLAQLADRGVADIGVFSGSGRAEQFLSTRADSLIDRGADVRSLEMLELPEAFRSADVIIGCSGGNRQITAGEIESLAGLQDRSEPLTVIDLALSHDFAPEITDLDGVELITLESVRMAAPEETQASVEQARSVVEGSVQKFLAERRERSADDAIVALRRHTQSVLETEMEKVRKQHGCTGAADEVEFAMRRVLKKLLHTPTVRAREMASEGRGEDYIKALEDVFGLEVAPREEIGRQRPARRRAEDFSAAELAQMAAYLQKVPEGGFCRHHAAGQFQAERLPAVSQVRRSA